MSDKETRKEENTRNKHVRVGRNAQIQAVYGG